MATFPDSITPEAFRRFRLRQRRLWRLAVIGLLGLAVAAFFVLRAVWSGIAGVVTLTLIILVGFECLRQWNRRRWLRRFPELATVTFPWRRDPVAGGPRLH